MIREKISTIINSIVNYKVKISNRLTKELKEDETKVINALKKDKDIEDTLNYIINKEDVELAYYYPIYLKYLLNNLDKNKLLKTKIGRDLIFDTLSDRDKLNYLQENPDINLINTLNEDLLYKVINSELLNKIPDDSLLIDNLDLIDKSNNLLFNKLNPLIKARIDHNYPHNKEDDEELISYNNIDYDDSILRDNNFINNASICTLEKIFNNMPFKIAFNMLQNKQLRNKLKTIDIDVNFEDKILFKGFLDNPYLVNIASNHMIKKMLIILDKDDVTAYLDKPYIENKLTSKELTSLSDIKNIDVLKILKRKNEGQDIINAYVNRKILLSNDFNIFKDNYFKNIIDLKEYQWEEINYLVNYINTHNNLDINNTNLTVDKYISIIAMYLTLGLNKTISIINQGNSSISLNQARKDLKPILKEQVDSTIINSFIPKTKRKEQIPFNNRYYTLNKHAYNFDNILNAFNGFDLEHYNFDKNKLTDFINSTYFNYALEGYFKNVMPLFGYYISHFKGYKDDLLSDYNKVLAKRKVININKLIEDNQIFRLEEINNINQYNLYIKDFNINLSIYKQGNSLFINYNLENTSYLNTIKNILKSYFTDIDFILVNTPLNIEHNLIIPNISLIYPNVPLKYRDDGVFLYYNNIPFNKVNILNYQRKDIDINKHYLY